ncbi:peroxide stress protein YaaA [Curvivirga aplysinae]|uniref:peroxide stress protein YaaA n=1 Tax=Curvivirga aplysinae TaxID=2529852 RepID=UPI0012BB7423|nr:peroxide stress protein YaaA [Curvivirga aplysinae]MTI10884.1 peroxide stress protein YaaA [Curvivirga aplysinae]
MLALVSPAKKLNMDENVPFDTHSQPDFLSDSRKLVKQAKTLSANDLSRMMKISASLAELNVARFKDFKTPFNLGNAKQAVLAFAGDTYVGLDASNLSEDDLVYAQDHLRILSGLYGMLRPLDLMQAYRLEMGTRFQNERGNDLYAFWGDKLSKEINKITADHSDPTVINCASNEYFKSVDLKALKVNVITPVFKEIKDGQAKMLGMFAKRARGMMARYIIENKIETADGLRDFNSGGYEYRPDLSDDKNWVYTREQPVPKK